MYSGSGSSIVEEQAKVEIRGESGIHFTLEGRIASASWKVPRFARSTCYSHYQNKDVKMVSKSALR
jgi:hypothetical protein